MRKYMVKYVCISLMLAILAIGIGVASTSSHGRQDDVPSKVADICAYIGIPMAKENGTDDNNSHPNPCDPIEFPKAVERVMISSQYIDNININNDKVNIGLMTPGHRTVEEITI